MAKKKAAKKPRKTRSASVKRVEDMPVIVIPPDPRAWIDTTRNRHGDASDPTTAREWTLPLNKLGTIIVHRRFACAGWFFSCHELALAARPCGVDPGEDEEDVEVAKRFAIDYIDKLLDDMVWELSDARKDLKYEYKN